MPTLIRYQDGVCDEKGEVIAVYTKAWWYEPKINKLGVLEMESCLKNKNDEYNSIPITATRAQFVIRHKELSNEFDRCKK